MNFIFAKFLRDNIFLITFAISLPSSIFIFPSLLTFWHKYYNNAVFQLKSANQLIKINFLFSKFQEVAVYTYFLHLFIINNMTTIKTCNSNEHAIIKLICCCLVAKSGLTLVRPLGLQPAKFLYPLDFPGRNTREGCHFLLQEILLTQGSNSSLQHWWAASLPLRY